MVSVKMEVSDIEGVGQRYAPLLKSVGVDTVVELAAYNGTALRKRLALSNASRGFVETLPPESMVIRWVTRARGMDLAV